MITEHLFWRSVKSTNFAGTTPQTFKVRINHIESVSRYASKQNYHFFFLSFNSCLFSMLISLASQIITAEVTPGELATPLLYPSLLSMTASTNLKTFKTHTLILSSMWIILILATKDFSFQKKKKEKTKMIDFHPQQPSLLPLLEKNLLSKPSTKYSQLKKKKKNKTALKFLWRNKRKYSLYEIKIVVNPKQHIIS